MIYILKKKRLADFCVREKSKIIYTHIEQTIRLTVICGRHFLFVRKGFDSLSGG